MTTKSALLDSAAFAEFFDLVKKGDTFIYEITPDLAAYIINERNPRNRDRSKADVEKYKKDMENDAWELNGSTLVFDTNGNLIDGGHRCAACIAANKPFKTEVSCGKDPKVVHSIDTGRKRNAKAMMQLAREDEPMVLSRCLVFMYRWETAGAFGGITPSNQIIERVNERHGQGLKESIAAVKPVLEDSDFRTRIGLFATLRYILTTREPDVAPYFDALIKTMAAGDWESDADPAASIAKMVGPGKTVRRITDTGRVGILLSGFLSQLQGRKAAGLAGKATHRFKQSELMKLLDQLAAAVHKQDPGPQDPDPQPPELIAAE